MASVENHSPCEDQTTESIHGLSPVRRRWRDRGGTDCVEDALEGLAEPGNTISNDLGESAHQATLLGTGAPDPDSSHDGRRARERHHHRRCGRQTRATPQACSAIPPNPIPSSRVADLERRNSGFPSTLESRFASHDSGACSDSMLPH